MKVAVIGGSGFVGSRLISILESHEVINIDKKESPFFQSITHIGDIRDVDSINLDENVDIVVLLAAEHKDNINPKELYYDVNVDGTKNVLNIMDEKNINNLIFTSSVAIYGLNKNNPSEDHIHDPFNHYGKSKWEAEKVVKLWYSCDKQKKSAVIIRPTVIFGERNRGNVYNLLKQICSGKFVMVGSGKNKKSMAYVGNVAALIKYFINNTKPGFSIFNYSDKPDFSMSELTLFIKKKIKIEIPSFKIPYLFGIIAGYFFDLYSFLSGKKLAISSVRIKKFCATTQFNSVKVHKIFIAPYSIEKALDKTIDYEFIQKDKDDILFFSE